MVSAESQITPQRIPIIRYLTKSKIISFNLCCNTEYRILFEKKRVIFLISNKQKIKLHMTCIWPGPSSLFLFWIQCTWLISRCWLWNNITKEAGVIWRKKTVCADKRSKLTFCKWIKFPFYMSQLMTIVPYAYSLDPDETPTNRNLYRRLIWIQVVWHSSDIFIQRVDA